MSPEQEGEKAWEDKTNEWYFPELFQTWSLGAFKSSDNPGVEWGIIGYILTYRQWNHKEGRSWCSVPINHLAKKFHVGHEVVSRALDHLEEQGIIRGGSYNNTAKFRRRPRTYRLCLKDRKHSTTPSSNSQVAEEIQRKVEAKTSRPSPAPSKAAPPQQPKTPIHSAPRSAPTSQAEWDAEMERRSAEKKKKQLAEEVELMKDPVYRAEKTKLLLKLGMTIEQIEARYGKAQGEK